MFKISRETLRNNDCRTTDIRAKKNLAKSFYVTTNRTPNRTIRIKIVHLFHKMSSEEIMKLTAAENITKTNNDIAIIEYQ